MTKSVIIKTSVVFLALLAVTIIFVVFNPLEQPISDESIYIPESTQTPTILIVETATIAPTPSPVPEVKITEESYTFGVNSWHYESPDIIIDITKTYMYDCDVFIADIIVSDMTQVMSGFAKEKLPPTSTRKVDQIAEPYHSVLAVNGDYITKSSNQYKSPVLKNGTVVRKSIDDEFLAVLPDRLMVFSMSDDISMDMLLTMGAYNTFTFGPILIKDSAIYDKVYTSRIKGNNPRCGVGQIDDNHLLVVLVDSTEYADGITLAQFAKIFSDMGATVAYNLDAGETPAMVFMGVPINFDNTEEYDDQQRTSDIIYFGESENSPDASAFESHFAEE